jgi:hypothetical protein
MEEATPLLEEATQLTKEITPLLQVCWQGVGPYTMLVRILGAPAPSISVRRTTVVAVDGCMGFCTEHSGVQGGGSFIVVGNVSDAVCVERELLTLLWC